MREITYYSIKQLVADAIFDSERGLPVEIICKIEDMKEVLAHVFHESSLEITYLSFNAYENNFTDDDAVSICLSCGEITVCDLAMNDGVKEPSGEEHIRYVSAKCNEAYFEGDSSIAVFKYTTMEENV